MPSLNIDACVMRTLIPIWISCRDTNSANLPWHFRWLLSTSFWVADEECAQKDYFLSNRALHMLLLGSKKDEPVLSSPKTPEPRADFGLSLEKRDSDHQSILDFCAFQTVWFCCRFAGIVHRSLWLRFAAVVVVVPSYAPPNGSAAMASCPSSWESYNGRWQLSSTFCKKQGCWREPTSCPTSSRHGRDFPWDFEKFIMHPPAQRNDLRRAFPSWTCALSLYCVDTRQRLRYLVSILSLSTACLTKGASLCVSIWWHQCQYGPASSVVRLWSQLICRKALPAATAWHNFLHVGPLKHRHPIIF